MDKKKTILFVLGVVIASAVIVFFYSANRHLQTNLRKAKMEMGTKDDPFASIKRDEQMLADPATGKIPYDIRTKELQYAATLPTAKSLALNKETVSTWVRRGPINRGGRTRALGVDIRTQSPPNVTILAGGVSGGIYKSTDNGATWVNKFSPNLLHSVSCLTQDTRPGHEDTWYAGSGEAIGNSANAYFSAEFVGDGVYKSTDNGETWALIPSTSNGSVYFDSPFKYVNDIAVNKSTGSIFVAASNVLMRSQDNGATWTMVRSAFASITMSDVKISSTGVIYAVIPSGEQDAGISTSIDDGATWTDITPAGLTNYQRTVMAIAPSNENILYVWAFTGTGPTQTELWKYDASNTNWTNLTANLPPPGPGPSDVYGINVQSSYDMIMKVKPDDENFVVVGGTNLYRSLDGFSTPVDSTGWIGGYATINNVSSYPNHHPDQHSLVFLNSPNSMVLFSGHDGGVSRTNDVTQSPVTWSILNSGGYITSQFYSVAIDPVTANDPVIAGGLQDNGNYTTFSTDFNTDWVDWQGGGDGGFSAVRKTAANEYTIYLEAQLGSINRQKYTSNGTLTAFDGIKPNYSGQFAFVNPFVLDPNNSDIMYFAEGDTVVRSTDVSTNADWQPLTNATTGSYITAVAVSKTPANRLYVGGGFGEVIRLDGANTGNPTAVNVSAGIPQAYVVCIYVDPANADNVITVLSNYGVISLWHSTNGGANWTDISGNLEQNADGSGNGPSCRWVTSVSNNGVMTYYVATSTGLYSTTNLNGTSTVWAQEGPNTIGNVVCTMVKGRDVDGLVVVGTHGMGVYSTSVATSVETEYNSPSRYTLSQNYPNPFNPTTTINFSLPKESKVKLTLFDSIGREVALITSKEYSAGTHSINYNASNLASGVYLYRIEAGSFVQSKKMVLLK